MNDSQLKVLKQRTREIFVKLDVINSQNRVVNTLEGISLGGNVSLNSESPYRRSGNISCVVKKQYNILPNETSNIWFDKRIGIKIGIKNYIDEVVWFNFGRFAVKQCDIHENISDVTMNISLVDYMALFDGTLGGILETEIKMVEKSISIEQAIKGLVIGLTDFMIEKIEINSSPLLLPYRIEKKQGATIYSILKEIIDLYMGYEMYFDENGYFIVKKIKDKRSDISVWNFNDIPLHKDLSNSVDFSKIKNHVTIIGYTDSYGVQIRHTYHNRFKRNTLAEIQAISTKDKNDIAFCVSENKSYLWNGTTWEVLSFNVISEFRSETIGLKKSVIEDGNIFNLEQAKLKAEFELTNMSRFGENISIPSVPIYSLDCNQKISITSENCAVSGDYITKSIEIPLSFGDDMSISATKIYY